MIFEQREKFFIIMVIKSNLTNKKIMFDYEQIIDARHFYPQND